MIRSILSVLAGYIFMAIGLVLFLAIAPNDLGVLLSMKFLITSLVFGGIVALVGGFITAAIAKKRTYRHVGILAGIIVVFSLLNILGESGKEPLWFQVANMVTAAACVLLGGFLKKKLM